MRGKIAKYVDERKKLSGPGNYQAEKYAYHLRKVLQSSLSDNQRKDLLKSVAAQLEENEKKLSKGLENTPSAAEMSTYLTTKGQVEIDRITEDPNAPKKVLLRPNQASSTERGNYVSPAHSPGNEEREVLLRPATED